MRKEAVQEIAKTVAIEVLGYRSDIIQEEFDKRYQDVKLLMRNYRKLKAYCSRIDPEVLAVDVICSTQRKTALMMSHVDKMLTAYKALCQKAETPDELRRWKVLNLRYMTEKRMKIDDIADFLHVNKRTLYRDTERAMEDMAVLLFGIEAIGTWKHQNPI